MHSMEHLQTFSITKTEVIKLFSFFIITYFNLCLILFYNNGVHVQVHWQYLALTIPGFLLGIQIFDLILSPVTTTVMWAIRGYDFC